MKKHCKKAVPAILAAITLILAIRLIVTIFPWAEQGYDTNKGLSYIDTLNKDSVADNEKLIRQSRDEFTKQNNAKVAAEKLKNGSFKAIFNDTIFCGDSLVKSIVEYNVLDSTQVIAKIGANSSFLGENSGQIANANPKYLVLHFGENELEQKEQAKYFIIRYSNAIKKIKKKLPDTEIFVDSIFPVLKKAYKLEPYTKNISYYNPLIKKMADELGVKYIDYTGLKGFFKKSNYDADGIHFVEYFYTKYYLPYVYTEVHS